MAQQQVDYHNRTQAEEVYRQCYVMHGECLRLASVCSTLGFSYDKEFNLNKIETIEDITDNIIILANEVKNRLQNPHLVLSTETLPHTAIDAIEHQSQHYFEFQRDNLYATLNTQYNFDQINHNLNANEDAEISYNNDSIEVLYAELFNDDDDYMNSTFNEEDEEASIVYLYSKGPIPYDSEEEDWDYGVRTQYNCEEEEGCA